MNVFRAPASTVRHELEVKRSRFIASVARARSRAEAEAFISAIRAEFSDASHNTFAYIAGMPGSTGDVACSDDGEVAGTAGRPMLNVLQHSELAEVVTVVTRYFGGTLLGAGGLQRAYSQCLKDSLLNLPTEICQRHCAVQLQFDFSLEANVRRELLRCGAIIVQQAYAEKVVLDIQVPESLCGDLQASLGGLSKGQLTWRGADA